MSMITKETAAKIWNCYNEIEKAEKLLQDMNESLAKGDDGKQIDSFGRKKHLQLGVPMGNDSHRLYEVRPELGVKVIESHIAFKRAELTELQGIASLELNNTPTP